jgi:DNA modification methylase
LKRDAYPYAERKPIMTKGVSEMGKGRMKEVLAGTATFALGQGDSEVLTKFIPDASLDSIVTDPPAGIGFMGKEWDGDKGGRDAWIAWLTGIMSEGFRALKPGGWAVVWAIPRTSGWTQRALEDAGFEIRDVITHIFGSGFPKSHNVSKAIDKHLGATRTEVVGQRTGTGYNHQQVKNLEAGHRRFEDGLPFEKADTNEYGPATPEARQWDGYGTALKPSSEHWILARKPLEGTVAGNVLAHGTGALNIDASRIQYKPDEPRWEPHSDAKGGETSFIIQGQRNGAHGGGRFPTNTLLSHSPDCERRGTKKVQGIRQGATRVDTRQQEWGFSTAHRGNGYADADGLETVEAWACVEGCPVAAMDAQSGTLKSGGTIYAGTGTSGDVLQKGMKTYNKTLERHNDSGGASRFFTVFEPEYDEPFLYCAKPSKREKNAGLEAFPVLQTIGGGGTVNEEAGAKDGSIKAPSQNNHPTVKSMSLMSWLIKLVTPPGGVVADFFMGSGTTGCSAVRDGFRFIGLEGDEHNVQISEARITHWDAQSNERKAS